MNEFSSRNDLSTCILHVLSNVSRYRYCKIKQQLIYLDTLTIGIGETIVENFLRRVVKAGIAVEHVEHANMTGYLMQISMVIFLVLLPGCFCGPSQDWISEVNCQSTTFTIQVH